MAARQVSGGSACSFSGHLLTCYYVANDLHYKNAEGRLPGGSKKHSPNMALTPRRYNAIRRAAIQEFPSTQEKIIYEQCREGINRKLRYLRRMKRIF